MSLSSHSFACLSCDNVTAISLPWVSNIRRPPLSLPSFSSRNTASSAPSKNFRNQYCVSFKSFSLISFKPSHQPHLALHLFRTFTIFKASLGGRFVNVLEELSWVDREMKKWFVLWCGCSIWWVDELVKGEELGEREGGILRWGRWAEIGKHTKIKQRKHKVRPMWRIFNVSSIPSENWYTRGTWQELQLWMLLFEPLLLPKKLSFSF